MDTRTWTAGTASGFGSPGDAVLCPECGDTYVHLVGVNVHQPSSLTAVRAEEVSRRQHALENPFGFRGTTVEVLGECEAGHAFALRLSFHKGQTFAWRDVAEPAGGHLERD